MLFKLPNACYLGSVDRLRHGDTAVIHAVGKLGSRPGNGGLANDGAKKCNQDLLPLVLFPFGPCPGGSVCTRTYASCRKLQTCPRAAWHRLPPARIAAEDPSHERPPLQNLRAGGAVSKTWYVNANIKDKPQGLTLFTGGYLKYKELCAAAVQDGYRGFVFERSQEPVAN